MNFANDLPLLAYLARKIRLDRGLSLENLKNENISVGTISNIENMEGNPSKSKVLYLFQSLNINEEELEEIKQKELLEIETLRRKLECVEDLINDEELEQAKKLLAQYAPKEHHALYPYFRYLQGLCYFELREWKKSQKIWEETLVLCKKQAFVAKHDLLAKCFNRLSTCWYAQNDLAKALYYVEEGLKQYKTKKQDEIKYALLVNKVLYLRKSDRRKEAVKLIKEVWPLINQIQSVRVKLILYKSYCILLLENQELNEALYYCKESIDIAHRNISQKGFLLDFLNILGSIYLKRKMYEQALEYFSLVFDISPDKKFSRRHADTYTYLTSLYTAQNDWVNAQECMKKALSFGREIKDDYRLSKILMVAGICNKTQKQYDEAIPLFKEAVTLCKENEYPKRTCNAVYELAACYDKIGNRKAFSQWTEEFYRLQRKIGWIMEEEFYVIF
ncbi:helix-turn-helix domain-containing protein [Shimazuella alba]|uniref:Tetratricopeptide repeat protein n=1 Tax=Shimazuella alba TaxID=2690964 RepID=A0A6I4VRK6_9BACL|nr:helix-turn-helix transcriptional regulator [Shimazuella alba]MXQ54289.1 tetratricopeptide repeat protein [Shimazuella alba]